MNRPEPGPGVLKARDGEPVFGEPWHAQTLALADLLVKRGVISPARWAETLGAEIAARKAAPDDRETYYRAVLAALERRACWKTAPSRARSSTSASTNGSAPICSTPHGQPVELAAGMEPD